MRIAALYDIHGNVFALEAVLAELSSMRPDAILIGGDIVAGPFPVETLERLTGLEADVRFIHGNTEREVVHLGPNVPPTWAERVPWIHDQLTQAQRDFLDQLPEQMILEVDGHGPALFCHGSPRSDEEIITALTSDERLREIMAGVEQRLVVGGHTHMQLDRTIDGIRFVNAGSVGMPYETSPGAYWTMLGSHGVERRRTPYDLEEAAEAIRASGLPAAGEFVDKYLLEPPAPAEVAEFFEKVARERAAASAP